MRTSKFVLFASFAWAGLAFTLTGCEDKAGPTASKAPAKAPARVTGDTSKAPAPDNTAINSRDAEGANLTPIDQKENTTDVRITADIRKRVLGESGLSINARNAKIITSDGRVTLRGPVSSGEEKETLERIALSIAGEGNVENLLEVAAGQPSKEPVQGKDLDPKEPEKESIKEPESEPSKESAKEPETESAKEPEE